MPITVSIQLLTLPSPLLCRQQLPQVRHADSLHGQHAVLQAVQILPMNGRYELARDETQEDARGEVVFA